MIRSKPGDPPDAERRGVERQGADVPPVLSLFAAGDGVPRAQLSSFAAEDADGVGLRDAGALPGVGAPVEEDPKRFSS